MDQTCPGTERGVRTAHVGRGYGRVGRNNWLGNEQTIEVAPIVESRAHPESPSRRDLNQVLAEYASGPLMTAREGILRIVSRGRREYLFIAVANFFMVVE